MLRLELINNIDPAFTSDYLIVRANLFDTGTHFHADHCSLIVVNDTLLDNLTLERLGQQLLSDYDSTLKRLLTVLEMFYPRR
jgi:hypothetical protein